MKIKNLEKHLTVVNLTKDPISEPQRKLLEKGLNFVPNSPLDKFTVVKDLNLFARKLTLKLMYDKPDLPIPGLADWNDLSAQEYRSIKNLMDLLDEQTELDMTPCNQNPLEEFQDTNLEPLEGDMFLKKESTFFPSLNINASIRTFVNLVTTEIEKLQIEADIHSNITKGMSKALNEFRKDKTKIIKQADKGGNIVIMTRSQYESMCYAILENKEWYKKTIPLTLNQDKQLYENIINRALTHKVISKKTYQFLQVSSPITQTFYALPKIHKSIKNPPGRPIVSGNGSLTEKASQYIDLHLQNHVKNLPSYVRDSSYLLSLLHDISLPAGTWLVTLDVEALYSSIPHRLGLKAVQFFLNQMDIKWHEHNNFILELLNFILTHNTFIFNGQLYTQSQGTAMGTTCAPSYANLFLGWWERDLFRRDDLSIYMCHIIQWHRYIDDIIFFWTGTDDMLQNFIRIINQNDINLHFTSTYSTEKIIFLDLSIEQIKDGTIKTKLYRKPTASNSILRANSSHPNNLIKSIPVGEYLRARRNCSQEEDFITESREIRKRLTQRGYKDEYLRKAFKRARNSTRNDLLFKREDRKDKQIITRFITTYTEQHKDLKAILGKAWPILLNDDKINKFIPPYPQITYRKAKSIKDQIISSHYNENPNKICCKTVGTFKCGTCPQCPYMVQTKFVRLPGGELLRHHHFANCNTENLVYLLQCPCGNYYVGKTNRKWRQRIREHVYDIKSMNMRTPIGRHFALFHKSNPEGLNFHLLNRIHRPPRGGNIELITLRQEAFWIFNLKANKFPGLNDDISYKPFLNS